MLEPNQLPTAHCPPPSAYPLLPIAYRLPPPVYLSWCRGRDSNSHVFRRQILSLVRLPISPPRHLKEPGMTEPRSDIRIYPIVFRLSRTTGQPRSKPLDASLDRPRRDLSNNIVFLQRGSLRGQAMRLWMEARSVVSLDSRFG